MKTFEQFNENDPYNEENWNETPRYKQGDNIIIDGEVCEIVFSEMINGYYWYSLIDKNGNYKMKRREDVLNHIKHPEWSIQKCLHPDPDS